MAHKALISLYCTGDRGLTVLQEIVRNACAPLSTLRVVVAKDKTSSYDGCGRIVAFCESVGVPWSDDQTRDCGQGWAIAVGWHRIIRPCERLVVLHDSLLPRYRGFAPVVTALLEREPHIGVTSMLGSEQYDRGDIIAQKSIEVSYPIKLADVLARLLPLYVELAADAVRAIVSGARLHATAQDESLATYSLWRDDADYRIDWGQSNLQIRDHINAVGPPYLGASTHVLSRSLRVFHATPLADVFVHRRTPGKVIFLDESRPVVVCGRGLLRLDDVRDADTARHALPLGRFRSRFV